MKRTRTPPAVLVLAMAVAALAFVWHQQVEVAAMPQLRMQFLALRCAAVCLIVVLGALAATGPRWTAIPFAVALLYTFTTPLFRFSGRSPLAWALPNMEFIPRTTGEYVTGTMELAHHVVWRRFCLAGVVAVLAVRAITTSSRT